MTRTLLKLRAVFGSHPVFINALTDLPVNEVRFELICNFRRLSSMEFRKATACFTSDPRQLSRSGSETLVTEATALSLDYRNFATSSQHGIKSGRHRNLTDIFVGQLVRQADPLRLVLHGPAVYDSLFELLDDGFVDSIALICVSASSLLNPRFQRLRNPPQCTHSSSALRGRNSLESCLSASYRSGAAEASPTSGPGARRRSNRARS